MRSLQISLLVLSSTTAIADSEPPPASITRSAPGSLALPHGKLSIALTFEIESTADRFGEPVAIAPDVSYGATDRLTVSVVHSKFATTGFRAVTGGGICLGDACPQVYNNVGAEALYALRTGPLAVAAVGGMHAMDLDRGFYDLKLGGRVRYTAGRAAVIASPSVLLAVTERTDEMDTRQNRDLYYVPVLATYKLVPALTAGLGSGVKGSLNDLGGSWELPLGVVATYAIDRRVTVGASFVFGKLLGGADDPPAPAPAATGADYRGAQLWIVVVP
jgi:hypothetical protein